MAVVHPTLKVKFKKARSIKPMFICNNWLISNWIDCILEIKMNKQTNCGDHGDRRLPTISQDLWLLTLSMDELVLPPFNIAPLPFNSQRWTWFWGFFLEETYYILHHRRRNLGSWVKKCVSLLSLEWLLSVREGLGWANSLREETIQLSLWARLCRIRSAFGVRQLKISRPDWLYYAVQTIGLSCL